MASSTSTKIKQDKLERQAKAYRKIAARFFESVLEDSPEDVVKDFKETGLYTDDFLNDMEAGLKKSSYGK